MAAEQKMRRDSVLRGTLDILILRTLLWGPISRAIALVMQPIAGKQP